MKTLAVHKVNMTQIFADNGAVSAATILKAAAPEDMAVFVEGDAVTVSGLTKGKGFQGVVKRHGFHGGPRSHGQKHSEREPGSLGGGGRDGGRVAKGKRMAGRMGGDNVTVQNLTILKLLADTNEIYVSGAVPGRRGSKLVLKQK